MRRTAAKIDEFGGEVVIGADLVARQRIGALHRLAVGQQDRRAVALPPEHARAAIAQDLVVDDGADLAARLGGGADDLVEIEQEGLQEDARGRNFAGILAERCEPHLDGSGRDRLRHLIVIIELGLVEDADRHCALGARFDLVLEFDQAPIERVVDRILQRYAQKDGVRAGLSRSREHHREQEQERPHGADMEDDFSWGFEHICG